MNGLTLGLAINRLVIFGRASHDLMRLQFRCSRGFVFSDWYVLANVIRSDRVITLPVDKQRDKCVNWFIAPLPWLIGKIMVLLNGAQLLSPACIPCHVGYFRRPESNTDSASETMDPEQKQYTTLCGFMTDFKMYPTEVISRYVKLENF